MAERRGSDPQSFRDWAWVAESLAMGGTCRLPVLSTVLVDGGHNMGSWVSLVDGVVTQTKGVDRVKVMARFADQALDYRSNANNFVAALLHEGPSAVDTDLLTAGALAETVSKPLGVTVSALQGYVVPSGAAHGDAAAFTGFANRQFERSVEPNGRTVETFSVSQSRPPGSVPRFEWVKSSDAATNRAMRDLTQRLLSHVGHHRQCSVHYVRAEFVLDERHDLWISRVAMRTRPLPPRVMDVYRPTRPGASAAPSALAGRAERRREISDTSVDEAAVAEIMVGEHQLARASSSGGARTLQELERVGRSAAAAQTLGSTQLDGCCGDFCGEEFKLHDGGGDGAGGADDHLANARAVLSDADYNKLVQRLGATPGGAQGTTADDDVKWFTIVRRWVVQARQEKPYVDKFQLRRKKGESGDYMNELPVHDVTDLFVGHANEQVRVCQNCYVMYSALQRARDASVAKLQRRNKKAKRKAAAAAAAEALAQRQVEAEAAGEEVPTELSQASTGSVRAPSTPKRPRPAASEAAQAALAEAADGTGPGEEAMASAQAAIDALGISDIAFVRGFSNPPVAVKLVTSAFLILVAGEEMTWAEARSFMANGSVFEREFRAFDPAAISRAQAAKVNRIISHPLFDLAAITKASRTARKVAEWTLGVMQVNAWRTDAATAAASAGGTPAVLGVADDTSDSLGTPGAGPGGDEQPPQTFAEKLAARRREQQRKATMEEQTTLGRARSRRTNQRERSLSPDPAAAPATPGTGTGAGKSRREKRERAVMQQQVMARLANPTADEASKQLDQRGRLNVYTCDNGTQLPYEVMGQVADDARVLNFVVVHDFFDTYDRTQIMFKPIVAKNLGCQVLTFNLPGQAHAELAGGGPRNPVLNNEFQASYMQELLRAVHDRGEMLLSRPFHLVGIGNGGNIATCFALRYGHTALYRSSMRSVVLLNGFSSVDEQLTGILHDAANVFAATPSTRPDVYVSYFSRHLFSEQYLRSVGPNLALNIYTAVNNPISGAGRKLICEGALHHTDLRNELHKLKLPLVMVQGTENVLVKAANLTPYLDGRTVAHLWSHQQTDVQGGIGQRGRKQLNQTLGQHEAAFVVWLKSGHEVRQECKHTVLDLLDALAQPSPQTRDAISVPHVVPSKEFLDRARGTGEEAEAEAEAQAQAEAAVSPKKGKKGKRKGKGKKTKTIESVPEPTVGRSPMLDMDAPPQAPTATLAASAASPVRAQQEMASMEAAAEGADDDQQEAEAEDQHRRERLQKTDDEFQRAMLAHKRRKRAEQDARRRRDEEAAAVAEAEAAAARIMAEDKPPEPVTVEEIKERALEKEAARQAERDATHERNAKLRAEAAEALAAEQAAREQAAQEEQDAADAAQAAADAVGPAPVLAEFQPPEGGAESDADLADLQRKFEARRDEMQRQYEEQLEREAEIHRQRLAQLRKDQETRRSVWAEEDAANLERLDREMAERKRQREMENRVARLEVDHADDELVSKGLVPEHKGEAVETTPIVAGYGEPVDIGPLATSVDAVLDELSGTAEGKAEAPANDQDKKQEEEDKGDELPEGLDQRTFDRIQRDLELAQAARESNLESTAAFEQAVLHNHMATRVQAVIRGVLGRIRAHEQRVRVLNEEREEAAATVINALARGFNARQRVKKLRAERMLRLVQEQSALQIQTMWRGFLARRFVANIVFDRAARNIQRVFRGHVGRMEAAAEYARQTRVARQIQAATKIQATWRMCVAREEFHVLRVHHVAATEVQRVFRGYVGRCRARRLQEWENAQPGAERLELGLKMIAESKRAFERQQEEMNALHRAQQKAETKVSQIHDELQMSEKELAVLERELQEIDQIEHDLRELTHEKDMLRQGVTGAAGLMSTGAAAADDGAGSGEQKSAAPDGLGGDNAAGLATETQEEARVRQAEAYALEMAIHLKRAEREKKKKELESEFAGVFAEVERKKEALKELESSIADMEATRLRKEREFGRLQRNLMELLEEQKTELDSLREKGIELETATATSAAAATATAQRAKEHEKKSEAMFQGTEELMKFQFMAMSLSYFSSLNMLKNLREINAETTAAAVASSADTAAAAASAAAAANIPSLKHLQLGATDILDAAQKKRKQQLAEERRRAEEAKRAMQEPFPENVRHWSVDDVLRWLDTLSLSQYKQAYKEATVDGEFLMELRPEDMADLLGMEHRLHIKKVMVARDKLRPLSEREKIQHDAVVHEDEAKAEREGRKLPELETVFSQVRNGRLKRLEESLNMGIDVDSVDEHGSSLLIVACQNQHRRIIEMLLDRSANINHQNGQGNTALHYAMKVDTTGELGEHLVQHGADDSILNMYGMDVYTGTSPDDM